MLWRHDAGSIPSTHTVLYCCQSAPTNSRLNASCALYGGFHLPRGRNPAWVTFNNVMRFVQRNSTSHQTCFFKSIASGKLNPKPIHYSRSCIVTEGLPLLRFFLFLNASLSGGRGGGYWTELCHMFGSKPDVKRVFREFEIFPLKRWGSKLPIFWFTTTSRFNNECLPNETPYRQTERF